MKKTFKNILCVCLVLSLAFAVAGCSAVGGSPEEKAVAKYVQANEKEVESTSSNSDIKCEMIADGTNIVYKYTLKTITEYKSEHEEDVEARFEDVLMNQEYDIYEALVDMQSEEPAISAIVFEYYDANGNKLFEKTYY